MGAPPTGEPDTDSGRESEVGEGPAHDDLETIGGADSHPAEPLRQAQGEPLREAQGGTPPDREPHEE